MVNRSKNRDTNQALEVERKNKSHRLMYAIKLKAVVRNTCNGFFCDKNNSTIASFELNGCGQTMTYC